MALSAASILGRSGVFSVLPNALARTAGALHLARVSIAREPAPVAPSAADVIDVAGAAKLLRYRSKGVALDKAPILLCPSLINRLYVLDLKEGISVVDVLLRAGHPVYGVDWGNPGPAEHGVSFEEFTTTRLKGFLAAACVDASVPKMTLLGHCLGGTMAACLAAVDDSHIQSLVLLTAPLTFHDKGLLSAWTRAPFFNPRDVTRVVGHVPGWVTQPAFQILKPMGQTSKVLRLWQNLGNPTFLEFFRCLETWINDNVSIPDGFFHDLVEQLYQKDALAQGTLQFKDGPVILEDISVPVLAIAAALDHIVPPASAIEPTARFASAQKQTEVLDGGHIGVVVGGLARRRLWPLLLEHLAAHGSTARTTSTKGEPASA
ncbi:MAG: alpha/beta fold hydrolase [Deltaproteobacteria bacterium]|nr:alpha/beta fold hydrolase [Deltaproteobacteria bacterium]